MPNWASYSLFAGVALKSAVVLGAAWLAALWLRKSSAATRHIVWTAAFAALLALPFLSMTLPALRVPVGGSLLGSGFVFQANSSASAQESAQQIGQTATKVFPLRPPWLQDWRALLMLFWGVGATAGFAQMFIGWAATRRLRRRADPLTGPDLASLAVLLEIEQEVKVFQTPRGSMPITYGFFRSIILMPADVSEWSAERRRIVLLHELAHVRRGDGATHVMARIALSLYWWNPLAWVAWREFLKERERAADDLVLNAGAGASEYATHLLEIARSMQSPAALEWTAVAMARRSQLEGRLLAILDCKRDRKPLRRASLIAASFVAIGIIAPLAAVQAQSTEQAHASHQMSPAAELIQSGDLERERGKLDRAKALYQKALAVSGVGPDGATAFIHLGTVELAAKQVDAAIADFQQAETADSAKAGTARMWMAIAQLRQDNVGAAEVSYQSALAVEDPNSAISATILELYAQLLRQLGRADEAKTMQDRASGIRKALAPRLQPSGPDVYRIGDGVTGPKPISRPDPDYTEEARIAKYQGTVVVSIEVGVDGLAHNMKIIRALGFGLDQKATEAIGRWKFKPATKDGQPVTVAAVIEVNFRLL